METYPISLALVDFLPNIAFLVGAFFLVKTARICSGTRCERIVMASTLLVFLGGFLKATWKLLYAAKIADFQWMSQAQFVLLGTGFLGMCVAVIYMVRGTKPASVTGGGMLAMAVWKIPFLFLMTITSLGAEGILAFIAFKRKALPAAVGFVVGVMGILAMGSLASAEQTITMQWVEETINTIGQLGFMMGCILLYQSFRASGCDAGSGD